MRLLDPPSLRALFLKWIVVAALLLPHGWGGWKGLAVAVFFTLIWDFYIYWIMFRSEKSSFDKYPILSQTRNIRVTDEGFGIVSGELLPWSWVDRVIETRTRYFVVMTIQTQAGHKLQHVVAIPKRAFDSPAQCAEFGALLNRKWAQHHPDVAPIAEAK